MVYKGANITYDLRKFKTIRAFGNEIRNNVLDLNTANEEQGELLKYIEEFSGSIRPRNLGLKELKKEVLDSATALLKGRERYLKHFKVEYFKSLKNHKSVKDLKY